MAADETYRIEFEGVDRGLERSLADVESALKDTDRAAKATEASLKGARDETARMAGVTRDANGRLRDARGRFVGAGEGAKGLSKDVGGLTGSMIKADLAVKAINKGVDLATASFRTMADEVRDSIKLYVDFEAALAQSAAATGGTIESRLAAMAKMGDIAKSAASTSKFSALEAAKGLDAYARAGLDVTQMGQLLGPTLNFATGNVLKLEDATRQAVTAKAAFNATADETVLLLDQMSKGATLAQTTVEQIGDAASRSAGSLKMLGNSNEDVIALNAALVEKTNSAELAGTALRGLSQRLTEIGNDRRAGKAFKELGIEIRNADGSARSMVEIVEQLEVATTKFDRVDLLRLATQAFGEFGKNAIMLTEVGSKKLRAMSDEIANAAGESKRMADMMQNTLEGRMAIMTGQVETLKTEFGEALTPAINVVLKGFGDLAKDLIENPRYFNAAITAMQGWVTTAGELAPTAGMVVNLLLHMAEAASTTGLHLQMLQFNWEHAFDDDLSIEARQELQELSRKIVDTNESFDEMRNKVTEVSESMGEDLKAATESMDNFRKSVEDTETTVDNINLEAFEGAMPASMKNSQLAKDIEERKRQLAEQAEWEKAYAEREASMTDADRRKWKSQAGPKPRKKSGGGRDREAEKRAKERDELLRQADQAWAREEQALVRLEALREGIGEKERARLLSKARLMQIAEDTTKLGVEREVAMAEERIRLEKELGRITEEQAKRREAALMRIPKAAAKEWRAQEAAAKKAAAAEKKQRDEAIKAWDARAQAVADYGDLASQAVQVAGAGEKAGAVVSGGVEAARALAATAAGFSTGNPAQFIAAGKHTLASVAFFKSAGTSGGGSAGGGGGGGGAVGGGASAAPPVDIARERRENARALAEAIVSQTNAANTRAITVNLNSPTILGTPEGSRMLMQSVEPEMRRVLERVRR